MKPRRVKKSIRQIFSGTGLKKGFSDQELVGAVKKFVAEAQSHTRQRKAKRVAFFRGVATGPLELPLAARDVLVGTRLERKIIERPGAAAMLAKEFRGKNLGEYFEKLAGKAVIKKIAERRRGIQKADRQWAEKEARVRAEMKEKKH